MRKTRARFSRTTTAAIGITAALGLAACSGSNSGSSGTAHKNKASATAKSTEKSDDGTTTPTPKPSQKPSSTIVLGWCTNGSDGVRAVQQFHPDTKDGETIFFPVEPMAYRSGADCNSNLPGVKARSAFSGNFMKLAAQHQYAGDGTYRIGYIMPASDPANTVTSFTDLSGISSGSGFGTTAKQSMGAFGPDGKIHFVADTGNSLPLMSVGTETTAKPVKQGRDNIDDSVNHIDPEDSADYLFYLPNGNTLHADTMLQMATTKDGSWVKAGDGTISYGKGNEKGKTTDPNYGNTLWPVWVDPSSPTKFVGWDSDKQIYRATISGSKVVTNDVLPKTDGEISEVTVNPDGTQAAFILKKVANGTVTALGLYTVSLKGNTVNEPVLVKDLSQDSSAPTDSFRIYAWN